MTVFAAVVSILAVTRFPSRVVVAGSSGRVGSRVVRTLLERTNTSVVALTRSSSSRERLDDFIKENARASKEAKSRLEIVRCDVRNEKKMMKVTQGADAAIWCATGFSDGDSAWAKLMGLISLYSKKTVDIDGMETLAKCIHTQRETSGRASDTPELIMCSSAGVTRTTWDEEKRAKFAGAADIPIVRLNPFGILDEKRKSEDVLRGTSCRYVVVRPTGLNDDWPVGRPVMSQGDMAVGRINRNDVAELLCGLLVEPAAVGKTFEVQGLPGFPKARSISNVLERFATDAELAKQGGTLAQEELELEYSLLQQLLPGEAGDAAALAAGQTYEQYDAGEAGRLGARGEEVVPIRAER